MDALDYIIEAQQRGMIPFKFNTTNLMVLELGVRTKGKCLKCGRIIGRGVWMHEKTCKGAEHK